MGDAIRPSRSGKPSVQEERPNNWTAKKHAEFLDHLATTCNVTKSAAATGMRTHMAYRLRRRDPVFAEQWRVALLTGYDRLEAKLVEVALTAVGDTEHEEKPGEPFDPKLAMDILKLYHARLHQGRSVTPGGPAPRRVTPEQADAEILKQLAALDRRRKAKDA